MAACTEFGNKIKIIEIPNIMDVFYGRGVGYNIEQLELSKELQDVSATKIRAGIIGQDGKLTGKEDLINYEKIQYYFLQNIDGTLFEYRKFESYTTSECVLLPGVKQKFDEWKASGHMIILTAARPEYKEHY